MIPLDPAFLAYSPLNDAVFVINIPQVKFGLGSTKEVGYEAKRLGVRNVLLVVGRKLRGTKLMEEVRSRLESEGVTVNITDHVRVEPEDTELVEAYREIKDMKIDGFVALGGGSTIDTAKVLNLLYTYPADLNDYINRPIGKGISPPGPLKPMIAIPTTAGTGSENTNVAIFDVTRLKVKTGISNQYLRPSIAIVDPLNTVTLPPMVTASSGLDVLNHAIESFTAHPYTARPAVSNPADRPVYAGSTPIGDLFASEAVRWVHRYLKRAYADPYDLEARYYMTLGASVAGIGFGHAGVHVPHAMAYPIAGMLRRWYPEDYEFGYPIAPHGISTAIPAAYAFRYLSPFAEERFSAVVRALGMEPDPGRVGDQLFEYYVKLLSSLKVPTSLRELDFTSQDLEDLVKGTLAQQRLLGLSPKQVGRRDLEEIFRSALEGG
ncbi:alcohol dehydrogenase [Sulfodiicoccus acidiphilus]|uniref:hydroxyacid-oxoacid transhydrogenase n=1 Tax=Sulfodiicoccus acidiphilus TaxID=1670455 RepID=A0A348B6K1_9CREN|nr:hydroxyacid-oxoacid transhydrogenase [Sulfodiicoccus acidiphilus]BBD73803.1 alcohol dehydrogenase [Sulfodiicoccus acidiphilus]GGU03618.1 alcohol dehydrogenase [Sulfodiicoccus acidiphilus]